MADSAPLSDSLKDLLDDTVFVTVGTVQPDGSPQLTPVWVKRDGDDVLISTTADRRKTRNIQRDPRVSLLVQPADDPYVYAELRGTATLSSEGADALIEELAQKYVGQNYREFNPGSEGEAPRVIIRVTPDRVAGRL